MDKEMMCAICGKYIIPTKEGRGSISIEILLWFLIIPGLTYSIWRLTSKRKVCPFCKSVHIFSLDSRIGNQLMTEFLKNKK